MWDLKLIFKILSTVVIVALFNIYHGPEALSRNILTIILPDSPILVTRKQNLKGRNHTAAQKQSLAP